MKINLITNNIFSNKTSKFNVPRQFFLSNNTSLDRDTVSFSSAGNGNFEKIPKRKQHLIDDDIDEIPQAKLFSTNKTIEIFKRAGIKTKVLPGGHLAISEYKHIDLPKMNIDENTLFSKVKIIFGDANFDDTNITNFDNLETIGGNLFVGNAKITKMKNLRTIGGDAIFSCSNLEKLPRLTEIGGYANFSNSNLVYIPKLTQIGGHADFSYSKIETLENLKSVGLKADDGYDFLILENSRLKSLPNLETVKGNMYFYKTKYISMPKLKNMKEAYFQYPDYTAYTPRDIHDKLLEINYTPTGE